MIVLSCLDITDSHSGCIYSPLFILKVKIPGESSCHGKICFSIQTCLQSITYLRNVAQHKWRTYAIADRNFIFIEIIREFRREFH